MRGGGSGVDGFGCICSVRSHLLGRRKTGKPGASAAQFTGVSCQAAQ